MCPEDKAGCGCPGHRVPGVDHIAPCCDEPHITEEEFEQKLLDRGIPHD